MTRFPALAPSILALFAARGAGMVEVPVLQPADPFLDMAGEDLRRRIFLTESETGETLCLRPEFTIPVCLDHIANRAATPRRYAYLGEVFRQRREGGNEFFQAGIEDLGDPAIAASDARSVADAHALLAMALPGAPLSVTLGDQTVFEAVLAALGLPRGWRSGWRAPSARPTCSPPRSPTSPTRRPAAAFPATPTCSPPLATARRWPPSSKARCRRPACRRPPAARRTKSPAG